MTTIEIEESTKVQKVKGDTLSCGFCGTLWGEVLGTLIVGRYPTCICDRYIKLCVDTIRKEKNPNF
jgi:hypothetical protein